MDSAYKLAIEIVANAKNFEVNVNKAGDKIDDVARKANAAAGDNSKYASSFGGIAAGVGKFLGIAGAAAGAIGILKTSMAAVEGPGDKLEAVMGGVKEAVFEVQRSIATLDFSNLISNFKEGFERGKKFTEMMDDLADRTAYNDYKVAGMKAQSAELQETIKNKTLEIGVRTDFAEKRIKIEEQIRDRTQELAQKAFLIEKQRWEERNEMSTEQAIKLYETIDNLSSDIETRLQAAFARQSSLFGAKKGASRILSGEAEGGMLRGIPKETIESYAAYLNLLKTGESDVLVKLFNTYKNIDQVRYESQRAYNMAIRETTMLLQEEERKTKTVAEALKRMTGPAGSSVGHLSMPGFGSRASGDLIPSSSLKAAEEPTKNMVNILEEGTIQTQLFMTAISGLGDAMGQMGEEGGSAVEKMARVILSTTKQILNAYLAEAIGGIIKGETKKGLPGIITATMGVGMLLALWKSKVPALADGGIAYGPTYAQVGEYPGARQDPEVISPLSKLKDIIGGTSQAFPQTMRISLGGGGSLYAYLDYRQRHINNYR